MQADFQICISLPLIFLAKTSIFNVWLGPECASADVHNTVLKSETVIFEWQQVRMESVKSSTSIRSLGQLKFIHL